ncbi:MAG: response regulator transcription factor [Alphaproteobacteria bacterium]|nr:response regulator transcription factor [Alphaproteobacteria bacterium]
MKKHVLVVDDDAALTEFLEDYLTTHGYEVTAVPDGPGMRRAMAAREVDLILLDLNLPGESGFDLMRSLRVTSKVPIIMLTGRSDEMDRVVGLEIGADDYIAKPFSVRELVARVGAVLRRSSAPVSTESVGKVGLFDGWRVDFAATKVTAPTGDVVKLTIGEFRLLEVLMNHANRVLTRDQLMDYSKGFDCDSFDRSIDIQIMRLRRKIETNPIRPSLIQTVRGIGYIFTPAIEWR